jgi:hypothetical protein
MSHQAFHEIPKLTVDPALIFDLPSLVVDDFPSVK